MSRPPTEPADDVDVAIVGARCSGSTLATLLARRGLRVCVLDKARFPSDTASTHIVHPSGTAVLDRLGVLTALRAAGAGSIDALRLVYDDACLDVDYTSPLARSMLSSGAHTGLSARRVVLDEVLIDVARAAGADVRTGVRVTGVERDVTGRVRGVQVGERVVRARVVVGADGRGSTVAALVGAREYATYPPGRLAAWGYFAGARDDGNRLRIGRLGEHAFVASPADGGLYTAGFVPASADKAAFLADRERAFTDGIRRWPELQDILAGATRVGPLRTITDWHGFFRESAGPGWVLTGDAGNFKDPSAAQGITDALRQAEHLADVLGAALADGAPLDRAPLGSEPLDRALRSWWRWRDADCRKMHWFAADMGAAGPTRPVTAQLIRDVADDEHARVQWLQVLNRDLAPEQLITWPRRARAVSGALRRKPRTAGTAGAVGAEIGHALGDAVRRGAWRPTVLR